MRGRSGMACVSEACRVFAGFELSRIWSIRSVYGWCLAFDGKRRRKTHSHALIEHLKRGLEVLYGSLTLCSPHFDYL